MFWVYSVNIIQPNTNIVFIYMIQIMRSIITISPTIKSFDIWGLILKTYRKLNYQYMTIVLNHVKLNSIPHNYIITIMQCHHCRKTYAKSYIAHHQGTCKENPDKVRFQCSICNKDYACARYLDWHRRSHTADKATGFEKGDFKQSDG